MGFCKNVENITNVSSTFSKVGACRLNIIKREIDVQENKREKSVVLLKQKTLLCAIHL